MGHPAASARPPEEPVPGTKPEALEPYAWEGDDDHVIFWMLSLTPTERVEVAQEYVDGVVMIRNGLRA